MGGRLLFKSQHHVMLDGLTTVAESEVQLAAGDLNNHIGEDRRGFEEVMGAHGFVLRNQEKERILELCQSKELRVINMIFRKLGQGKENYNKIGGAET